MRIVRSFCLGTSLFLAALSSSSPGHADALSTKLYDGFEGKNFTKQGGLYYKENDEQAAGTYTFQQKVKRVGKGALELSVKEHCEVEKDGCSERAEIWERPELRVPYDKAVWVGFSVKFGDPIPTDDHRYLIAQWKREIGPEAKGDFSPFLALRLRNGKLFATVETNYHAPVPGETAKDAQASCKSGETPVWLREDTNQIRAIVAADTSWTPADGPEFTACSSALTVTPRGNPLPLPASGWIDFAILTKPGPDGTGHIEVFADKKWIVTIKGAIGHGDPGLLENQYFKFGPYRAAGKGNWTMYYDEYRRSPACMDVLKDRIACDAVH